MLLFVVVVTLPLAGQCLVYSSVCLLHVLLANTDQQEEAASLLVQQREVYSIRRKRHHSAEVEGSQEKRGDSGACYIQKSDKQTLTSKRQRHHNSKAKGSICTGGLGHRPRRAGRVVTRSWNSCASSGVYDTLFFQQRHARSSSQSAYVCTAAYLVPGTGLMCKTSSERLVSKPVG